MKIDEFKFKLMKFGNNLINSYFPNNTLTDKGASSMLKYVLKNKINDLDGVLQWFTNSDNEIDIEEFIEYMKENMIGSGIKLNLQDYIPETSFIRNMIPNRTLIITKEDLDCFLKS